MKKVNWSLKPHNSNIHRMQQLQFRLNSNGAPHENPTSITLTNGNHKEILQKFEAMDKEVKNLSHQVEKLTRESSV